MQRKTPYLKNSEAGEAAGGHGGGAENGLRAAQNRRGILILDRDHQSLPGRRITYCEPERDRVAGWDVRDDDVKLVEPDVARCEALVSDPSGNSRESKLDRKLQRVGLLHDLASGNIRDDRPEANAIQGERIARLGE